MQEREFYEQILGLRSSWRVSEVKLDTDNQRVDVFVEHSEGTKFCCPECQQELANLGCDPSDAPFSSGLN